MSLLSYKFREFGSITALSILEAVNVGVKEEENAKSQFLLLTLLTLANLTQCNAFVTIILLRLVDLQAPELSLLLTPFDLKRLESYANNMLDYHVILDLMPTTAGLYFQKRLGGEVRLTAVQSAILLAVGLQRKTIEEVEVRGVAPRLLISC